MGVAISVFSLAQGGEPERIAFLREEFAAINKLLQEENYPPHVEPESIPEGWKRRSYVGSFPYECMRHLRRYYENVRRHKKNPKTCILKARRTPDEIDEAEEWIADTLEYDFDHNLLVHSITAGYYVPMPNSRPLCGQGFDGSGFLGSSNGLLEELGRMAAPMGITLVDGVLSDEEYQKVWAGCRSAKDPLMNEKTAWLTLFETATASVRYHTAVVLH